MLNLNKIYSKEVVVIFTDIEGFTKLSAQLEEDIFLVLNTYFSRCWQVIEQYQAVPFETVSDGWIILLEGQQKEWRGFQLSIALQQELTKMKQSEEWQKLIKSSIWESLYDIKTRIGLHSGKVVTGKIGVRDFFRHCLVGEAAEVAAKMESGNRLFETKVLFTNQIQLHIPENEREHVRQVDHVRIKPGAASYELYTYDFKPAKNYKMFRKYFDEGFSSYLKIDIPNTLFNFKKAYEIWPEDNITNLLIRRFEMLLDQPKNTWDSIPLFQPKKK